MKIIFGTIGAVLLIGLFFVVYQVVTLMQPYRLNLTGFGNESVVLGQAGGFHLLTDIQVIPRAQYDSVAIYTKLNRSSAAEDIVTPLAQATPDGKTGIRIKLSDTAVQTDLPKADYERVAHQAVSDSIIRDVALANPGNRDTQEVIISLTKSSRYRLSVDPQNAGILYVDVLK